MKRNLVVGIGVLVLMVLAWWAGSTGIGRPQSHTAADRAITQSQTPNMGKKLVSTKTGTSKPTPVSFERSKGEFKYKGWKIDITGERPRVCIGFSADLPQDGGLQITDYITTEPNAKLTADINGNMVCLSGLSFGKDYQITLRKGLKSKSGNELANNKNITVAFGNRPAHISFAGNGVILPRIGASGVAIESVNVNSMDVEILRVGDRIIAQQNPDIGSAISEGDYGRLDWDVSRTVRETVWKGTIKVDENMNQIVTTVIPLKDLVGELKPGAYIVVATRSHDAFEDNPARAWRWIISTDIALTTYQGSSGLDAIARSISTAEPLANTKINLIAVNNEILATETTDKNGHVHFGSSLVQGKAGMAPRMLMAYGSAGDYALLDFRRSPLDLSAFDIGGRSQAKSIDAYAFTERGVYRPGETVNLTTMLRDRAGKSISDRNGEIRYLKPNGSEFRKIRFSKNIGGTVLTQFDVPASAPRGIWKAVIKVDGIGQVGKAEFSVEDFVPEKLRVNLNVEDTPIRADEVRPIALDVQFLYGAPGAGLETEAEARVRIDPNPFKDYATYSFGDINDTFQEEFLELGGGVTDGKGRAEFGIKIDAGKFTTSHPLRAEVTVGVAEPGGRYIKQSKRIPIRLSDVYIGIDPEFDTRVGRGKPANFKIIALDWKGKPTNISGAKWTLVEEDWNYVWYRRNGRWQYRRDMTGIELATGHFDVDAQNGAAFSRTLDWGDYRLEVEDEQTGAKTSYRFYVGWRGGNTSDAPDQIQIAGPTKPVKAGETITLALKSPYAGKGELVIADDQVRSIHTVEVAEGGSEIRVKIDDDITGGAYAMLSVYTPRDKESRPLPRRAVGIGYIGLDTTKQNLDVKIIAPERTKPRQTETISVDIGNIPPGEKAWLTLAAIDEGVLQVTKYKSPDPHHWYFGKHALNIDVRDDYARLLNPNLGNPALAKSGGDGLGGEGLTAVPTKVISLFSGVVKVKGGTAKIKLELPDFNGEVRLMAVAWSDTAVGSASTPMKVRDDVPAILSLPRFMAPGDRAYVNLSLDNVDGKTGTYVPTLSADAGISVTGPLEQLSLKTGERKSLSIPIIASETGVSDIKLSVKGPGGYKVVSPTRLQTRSPYRPITKVLTGPLAPGESYKLGKNYLDGFDVGSVDITVSFSNTPGLDPAAYAASVAQYPYGCTEQTVSRAMPLLYAADIGGVPGLNPARTRFELQKAVDKIANRQDNDGAFGLWYAGDGYARPWIGVYAADFLQRASEKEFLVSDEVLDKAYQALNTMTKMYSYPGLEYQWNDYRNRRNVRKTRQAESAAYAHYVLARAGRGNLSSMRYFYDNHAKYMHSPISWGHLGAALAMMDDKTRSDKAFSKAVEQLGYKDNDNYYQTPLRDAAGVLAVATEAGSDKNMSNLLEGFLDRLEPPNRLSTQEKAQTILAIRAQLKDAKPIRISATHAKITTKGGLAKAHLYGKDLLEAPSFTNKSKSGIWRSLMISGSPLKAPPAQQKGYRIEKKIYDYATHKPADISKVKRGDRLVVFVRFNADKHRTTQAVLADLLPAGVEIETILSPEDGQMNNGENGPFEWLGELDRFQITEARDDRLVAALQTYGDEPYAIAYIVRATVEGDFVWPGAVVEDMYRPQNQSITAAKRVQIGAGPEG